MSSNRPKTVLYLTPSARLLGARRSLLGLAANLDPERWKPVVCGQSAGDLSEALEAEGISYRVLKTGWWRKGKYFLWRPFAISQLAALIRKLNVDLVHCNEIYPNPYAVRACARPRHGRHIPVVTHMRLSATPRMIRNYDLPRADLVVVPSEGAGRDFDIWPNKSEKVAVVYNGVDLREFRRTRTAAEARRIIGVPGAGPLLAAIGQLGARKGGDLILGGFRKILARFPDATLMFVGNPHRGQEEFEEQLRATAQGAEFKDKVFFFPFTKQILAYYEAADVNLLISRDEGFGRTVIEAGSLGVPSIATRVGGLPELIVDGKTGLLIDPENVDQLAEAMEKLLENPALRSAQGEAVFRHVAQNFSITSHTEKIMNIYDLLVSGESPTSP